MRQKEVPGYSHSICDTSLVGLKVQIELLLHHNHTLDTIDPNVHRAIMTSTREWQDATRESDSSTTEELRTKLMTLHTLIKIPSSSIHLRGFFIKSNNMRTRASGCLQGKTSILHPTYRNSYHRPHHPCTLFRLPYQNHRLHFTQYLR